jgi:hypothetical protein
MVIEFPQWRVATLYEHVGRIAIEWGFMDFAISGTTAILFSIPEAAEREKVLPRALGRRLGFIARSLKDIDELAPFRNEGQDLVDRVRLLQPLRDGVIHGYPSMYETETGKIIFFSMDVDPSQTIHQPDETVLTIGDLIGAGRGCHHLAADFSIFGHKLIDAGVARDKREDAPGKVGG